MSHENNTILLDRVGELLDDDRLTDEQVDIVKTLIHNHDLSGLQWALNKIEQDIADREQKSLKQAENSLDEDFESDLERDNEGMVDLGADGANEARLTGDY